MNEPPCTGRQACKFEKGENSRFQGMIYQIYLTAFCLIQAFGRFANWKLSSENAEAGKFDDIVIESLTGDFLLQAKFKSDGLITLEDLFSTDSRGTFALAKYFLAYQRVKARFKVTNLALCSNATIVPNTVEDQYLRRESATADSVLYCQGRKCIFYSFNKSFMPMLKKLIHEYVRNSKTDFHSDIFTDDDIVEFLGYLRLYYDYPCPKELVNAMEQSLPLVRLTRNVLMSASVQDITFKVIEWYETPRGDCEYLTERRLTAMFSKSTHTGNQVCPQTFKKGGDVGITSMMFQIELITVVLLTAIEEFGRFRLSFKNSQADKFDNILLQWPGGSFAIQLKYKANKTVTVDELLAVILPKYFTAYQKIRNRFREFDVVICTNASVTTKRGQQNYLKKQNSASEFLCSRNWNCSVCAFEETVVPVLQRHTREYLRKSSNDNDIDDFITDDKMRGFLARVRVLSDYPLGVNSNAEKALLRLSSSSDILSDATHEDVTFKVMEWFQQPRGPCEYMTDDLAVTMFSEIKSNKFRDKLDRYNVLFSDNSLIFDSEKRIFYVPFAKYYLLKAIKVFRVLQCNQLKALYVAPDSDTLVQKHIVRAFEHPSYHYLIIVCQETRHLNELLGMYKKLTSTFLKYRYKRVVLVGKSDALNSKAFEMIELSVGWDDFSIETQASLLSKEKFFLNGKLTSMGKILASVPHNRFTVSLGILDRIVRDEQVVVSVRIHDLVIKNVNQKVLTMALVEDAQWSPIRLTETSQGLTFELS